MEKTRREQLIDLVRSWTKEDGPLVVFSKTDDGIGFMSIAGVTGENKAMIASACVKHPILSHILMDSMAMAFLQDTEKAFPFTAPLKKDASGSVNPQNK